MTTKANWWRSAVIYQVYPRSFNDSSGDGMGDLPGVLERLEYLEQLGVDAIWLSPFYPSPQLDGGYDISNYCDVDPMFGTLEDLDDLVSAAHERSIRVTVDLVPNHCSWEHPKFKEALAAGPDSPERDMFIFRPGRGTNGEHPPTNWLSGAISAWTQITEADGTPGPWYLHLFDSSQPDWNWQNSAVWDMFAGVLRFWLDRGIAGFRVDVSHGLMKDPRWQDWDGLSFGLIETSDPATRPPFWDQDEVHSVYRHWRKILDEYDSDRIMAAEAWLSPDRLCLYVRPDEMHQAFNFAYLETGWNAQNLRETIDRTRSADQGVGAPTTWVLSNHDVIRHATRFGYDWDVKLPFGIGPNDPAPDTALGLKRARAASLLMLSLPGCSYLYQGEELGLPEAIDIPDSERQDPHWISSKGQLRGRDGCRAPMPWDSGSQYLGFSTSKPWLTAPTQYQDLAVNNQITDPNSTLALYKNAIKLRKDHGLGSGDIAWLEGLPQGVLGFENQNLLVLANTTGSDISLDSIPRAQTLVSSHPGTDFNGVLTADTTIWLMNL